MYCIECENEMKLLDFKVSFDNAGNRKKFKTEWCPECGTYIHYCEGREYESEFFIPRRVKEDVG